MKKLFALICMVVSLCLTSCLSSSDNSTRTFGSYFTITGMSPNYTLLSDDGMVTVNLDPTSAASIKGLESNKRGMFYVQYDDKNVQTDPTTKKSIVNNGVIIGGEFIPVINPMTAVEAEQKMITAVDSTFEMNAMSAPWSARGYITTQIQTYFFKDAKGNGIYPDFNFVVDEAKDITTDAIKYTVHCNRHGKKTDSKYGPQTFNVCFDARYSLMSVPGSKDSIDVTISGNGFKDATFKVSRRGMLY